MLGKGGGAAVASQATASNKNNMGLNLNRLIILIILMKMMIFIIIILPQLGVCINPAFLQTTMKFRNQMQLTEQPQKLLLIFVHGSKRVVRAADACDANSPMTETTYAGLAIIFCKNSASESASERVVNEYLVSS